MWSVTWKIDNDWFGFLRTLAEERNYEAGEVIFEEGDPPDGMYLVVRGTASVNRHEAGQNKQIGQILAGGSFGELGLLIDKPRGATVIAQTELLALKITPYVIDVLRRNAPDIGLLLFEVLARSLATQVAKG
jgi:CRP-like cAMP-binding protein